MRKFNLAFYTSGAFLIPFLAYGQGNNTTGSKFNLEAIPTDSIFSSTDKPTEIMNYALWVVTGAAGVAAIMAFIIAGNAGTRGDWNKCLSGVVGGIICAIASYLTLTVQ